MMAFVSKSFFGMMLDGVNYFQRICRASLQSKGFQKLLSYPDDFRVDLIIYDYTTLPCLLGFMHKFGYPPKVGITAFGLPPQTNDLTGSPNFPSLIPFYASVYSAEMNFWQRSLNAVYYSVETIQRRYSIYSVDQETRTAFGIKNLPYLSDLEQNTDLVLVNSHSSMDIPDMILPNVVQVGGLQITEAKALPTDISSFIESSKKGAILFSLGTNMKSEYIGEVKIEMFMKAIESLPDYNFLWKIELQRLKAPKNLMVRKWLPQSDILAHSKVKLFLTHGGLLSSQEATWYGVPMLGLPFFVDQMTNVQKSIDAGVSERLDFFSLTEDEIRNKLKCMLEDPSYQRAMSVRSRLFRDRPRHPLQEAVWWCEYVLRNKGAPHLRSAAASMSPFVFFMWDLLLVWSFVLVLVLLMMYLVLKKLFRRKYIEAAMKDIDINAKKRN